MTDTAQTPAEPQRMRALEHANAVRLARADLKRRIGRGEVSAAEVILECPEAVRRWTVSELLMAQRRWGSTRCRKFLERNGVSEIKPVGSLTERQRRLLADELVAAGVGPGPAAQLARPEVAASAPITVPERVLAFA